MSKSASSLPKFGPFWRSESKANATKIENTGELWGYPPIGIFHSNYPTVQAYPNALPQGKAGIEFYTDAQPTYVPVFGGQAWWRGMINSPVHKIKVVVTKNTT